MKFKLGSVIISLSYPLTAAICIVLVVDHSFTAFCGIINAALHELGHIILLRRFGCKLKSISMGLFDINIKKYDCRLTINQEIAVALSGVAANLICAVIYFLLFYFTGIWLTRTLFLSAVFLACFNLLPVEALDGGCALNLLLLKRFSFSTASRMVTFASLITLSPMLFLGAVVLLNTKYNFTLLFTSCYLLAIILLKKKREHDLFRN